MSNGGPSLLLIDGNNMSHRVFHTHQELQHKGRHTGVLFGFMKQLITLRKLHPEYFLVITWDGGYARRKAESIVAKEAGIVPEYYKEAREKARKKAAEEDPKKAEEQEDLHIQMEQLQDELLPLLKCVQAKRVGFEGDDLVYSYCKYVHKWNGRAIAVSSDNDFLQLLGIGPEIKVYDAMKQEMWTAERFQMEFNFSPTNYVDYGAIVGETGPSSDNIFGVDGWGPKTTGEYMRQYGSYENIMAAIKAKPKLSKREQTFLASGPRFALARSLKQMDEVAQVPMPRCDPRDYKVLHQKFIELGFISILKEARLLT
jgi:DNA polymerase I